MPYATVTDMQNRYPARDLIAISDPNNVSIQNAVIDTALSDASNEEDTYLESRFSLPLTDPPAILTQYCCYIAMYRLASQFGLLHDMKSAKDRYDEVIKVLQAVKDGTQTLGLATDGAEPPTAKPSVMTSEPRGENQFGRGKLKVL